MLREELLCFYGFCQVALPQDSSWLSNPLTQDLLAEVIPDLLIWNNPAGSLCLLTLLFIPSVHYIFGYLLSISPSRMWAPIEQVLCLFNSFQVSFFFYSCCSPSAQKYARNKLVAPQICAEWMKTEVSTEHSKFSPRWCVLIIMLFSTWTNTQKQ